MTDEMLELARANAAEAGVENVEFLKGYIEEHPPPGRERRRRASPTASSTSPPTSAACSREAARVLRPGGRFAVSDVIADPDMDDATREDMQQWTGCIAGALTRAEFERRTAPTPASSTSRSRETHRVHEHAGSAIIRARRPAD